MRFANWPFLFLVLLIPVLYRWWFHRNRQPSVIFPISIPKTIVLKNPLQILLGLKYISLFFLFLALARPQSQFTEMDRSVSGIDIMMVLDVSASMNIEDLAERSRLDVAKDTMSNFVKGRPNDRIGFVIFSGEPLSMAPPTLDHELLMDSLNQARSGVLKDGTAIGDGLVLTLTHLKDSKAKSRVVILLTDGDNNIGQIDPATAGEMATGYGVRVYTIAIGREGRVKMPIRQKGVLGGNIIAYQWFDNALNPELLKQISEMTHGKFYRVTDENTLISVFKEIDQLEKSDVQSKERVQYQERFDLPLKLALFFLALQSVLQRVIWRFFP